MIRRYFRHEISVDEALPGPPEDHPRRDARRWAHNGFSGVNAPGTLRWLLRWFLSYSGGFQWFCWLFVRCAQMP